MNTSILATLLLAMAVSAQGADSSALDPRTGPAIQDDALLPLQTKRGRCNPADPLPIATPSSPTEGL